MKRRIAMMLCAIIAAVMAIPTFAAEETGTNGYTKAERFMIGTGIFDMDYSPNKEITRGEFAAILTNALHIADPDYESGNTDSTAALGDSGEEVQIYDGTFRDVDASHPYYSEILEVCGRGLMVGVSDNLFAPEYGITLKEVQKVIVSMLGYNIQAVQYGGYPKGYITTAANLGLLKGVGSDENSVVTQKMIINILYNALDVKLLVNETFYKYTESDDTFMTGVLMIGKTVGVMADNGYTSINGASGIAVGSVKVGDIAAEPKNSIANAREYIGRRVEMYYSMPDNYGKNVAVYIAPLESDDVITFDIRDFISFDGNTVSFEKDNKPYKKRVGKNATMIINNETYKIFDENSFKFKDGDVTIITGNDGYCTIIANKYEYAIISSIDDISMRAYNKLKGEGTNSVIDFSGSDVDEDCITVLDENNQTLRFSDLAVGDTLNIRRSKNYMIVERINNTLSDFLIKSIRTDGKGEIYSSDNEEYTASRVYETLSNREKFTAGMKCKLYFNKFDEIIWIESGEDNQDGLMGIITMADSFEEDETRIVKLYTQQGKIEKFNSGEKLLLNGQRKKFDDILIRLKAAIGELVIYKTDEGGILTEIILPNSFGEDDGNGWYELVPEGRYYFEGQGLALSTLFFSGDDTVKFTIPESESEYRDEKKFSVNSIAFSGDTYYTVRAYARNKNDVIADAIVLRREAASGGTVKDGEAFIISSILETINEDDEICRKITGYRFKIAQDAKYEEYYIAEDAKMVGFGEVGEEIDPNGDVNSVGPRNYNELQNGDIIYFNTNSRDEIETIRIAYDCSTKKAFNAGRGSDFYDPNVVGYASSVNTTWAGTIISRYNDGVKIARNYKPQSIDYSNFADYQENVVASQIRNPNSIMLVDMSGKKADIRTGTFDDIVSYEDTGDADIACDIVVLAYWRSYNYGTIIYKK